MKAKPSKQRKSTNLVRCIDGREVSVALGIERASFEPIIRNGTPTLQDALGSLRRLKTRLGVNKMDLASLLGLPRSSVAGWFTGFSKPEHCARMLLVRLERELLTPQDDTDPAQDTPTGSVQPVQDVIFTSKPGDKA